MNNLFKKLIALAKFQGHTLVMRFLTDAEVLLNEINLIQEVPLEIKTTTVETKTKPKKELTWFKKLYVYNDQWIYTWLYPSVSAAATYNKMSITTLHLILKTKEGYCDKRDCVFRYKETEAQVIKDIVEKYRSIPKKGHSMKRSWQGIWIPRIMAPVFVRKKWLLTKGMEFESITQASKETNVAVSSISRWFITSTDPVVSIKNYEFSRKQFYD